MSKSTTSFIWGISSRIASLDTGLLLWKLTQGPSGFTFQIHLSWNFGKSDSFSLVVGNKPVKKSYWKGLGFYFGGVKFCGVFVID